MISRTLMPQRLEALRGSPVVAPVGARQVGKTTLARELARRMGVSHVFLDLERPSDLAKLQDPELYLSRHEKSLVVPVSQLEALLNLP
jgi:uncharacterized protein